MLRQNAKNWLDNKKIAKTVEYQIFSKIFKNVKFLVKTENIYFPFCLMQNCREIPSNNEEHT